MRSQFLIGLSSKSSCGNTFEDEFGNEIHGPIGQLLGHVAHAVDWFIEGAFRPEGFDIDVEKFNKRPLSCTSLKDAQEWFKRAYDNVIKVIENQTEDELNLPLPEGPLMGGLPRHCIISALCDHTSHHHGALTIYSRLCDRKPKMPYSEM